MAEEQRPTRFIDRARSWFGGREKSLGSTLLSSLSSFSYLPWSGGKLLNKYQTSTAVYGAVSRIARRTSATQANLYRIKNLQGDTEEVFDHPVIDLIYRPNPLQTKSEFWQILTINKQITGEAIILKVRNERGQVVELINLRPDRIIVVPDEENFIKKYQLEKGNGTRVDFDPKDIIHWRNPNPDDQLRGMSPLLPVQLRVETEEEAAKTQCAFFQNGARPDFLLTTDAELSDEQRGDILSTWNKKHQGSKKKYKGNILEGGLKYQQVSLAPEEVGYTATLLSSRDDIYAAFGVPKALVDSGNVNKTDAEHAYKSFITDTIIPELVMLFEVLNEQLVIPDFSDDLFLDFVDPTPKDRTQLLAEWTAGVDKWVTRNEIREEMNLPSIDGGDTLYGSIANVPVGTLERTKSTALRLLRGRMKLKIKLQLRGEIKKLGEEPKPAPKKKAEGETEKPERTFRKLVPDVIRTAYAEAIVKRLDAATLQLKEAVEKFAEQQRKRFVANAEIKKTNATLAEKLTATEITNAFNIKEENKLLAKLSLPYLTEYLTEAGKEALAEVNEDQDFNTTQRIEELLVKRSRELAESVNNTTLERLTTTLAEGIAADEGITDLSKRVKEVYTQFPEYRAETIARTEATAANNEGLLEGYQQSRVVNGKEWIATLDDRTREEHLLLDGDVVGLNENFSNGLPYPQEINCRCVTAPVVIDE